MTPRADRSATGSTPRRPAVHPPAHPAVHSAVVVVALIAVMTVVVVSLTALAVAASVAAPTSAPTPVTASAATSSPSTAVAGLDDPPASALSGIAVVPGVLAVPGVSVIPGRVVDDPPGGSAAPYAAGLAGSAVGQLLSPSSSCTATVIPSRSGRIAVTAAHCVYIHPQRPQSVQPPLPPGWIGELVFYPGRTGDDAHGAWPVTRAWIDASYRDTADPAADVAFLELAPPADGRTPDGRTAQQVLGAQPATFTGADVGSPTTTLGYPSLPPFDGVRLHRCTTPATDPHDTSTTTHGGMVGMACSMTAGSSGGPWLTGFDAATGTGTLTAVTSFRTEDGLIVAAPLGQLAEAVFDAADTSATRIRDTVTRADPSADADPADGRTGAASRAPSGRSSRRAGLTTRPARAGAAAGAPRHMHSAHAIGSHPVARAPAPDGGVVLTRPGADEPAPDGPGPNRHGPDRPTRVRHGVEGAW